MRYAICAIGLALVLSACQSNEQNIDTVNIYPPIHSADKDTPPVDIHQTMSGAQDRGGNSPSTLNPPVNATVTTGDLQGLPGLGG